MKFGTKHRVKSEVKFVSQILWPEIDLSANFSGNESEN